MIVLCYNEKLHYKLLTHKSYVHPPVKIESVVKLTIDTISQTNLALKMQKKKQK